VRPRRRAAGLRAQIIAEGGSLREHLAKIQGVDHVVIDQELREAWLILRADADADAVLAEASASAPDYEARVAVPPERRDRQRVRFVELRRDADGERQVRYTVVLEWAGVEHHGSASGEIGEAVELRTVASAALAALESVADNLGVSLAGVKQLRAFDADLVVVSLYRPGPAPRNLVGVVLAADDSRRATAVAVLAALNRLLGNYLALR
jgi:hypothetical protein